MRSIGTLASLFFVVALSLFYGRVLVNFDPTLLPAGREVEWTVEADGVAWQSLLRYSELPLWNPYWHAGRPLLADPLFHGLDPKMLLPQALFGVINGSKLGLWLSFAVMGAGGWWLGGVLGLGGVGRGWLGTMLAMCGQLVGYFSGVASLGLGLSLVYVPWVFAATLALWQRPEPRRAAWLALALACLFVASNFYFFAYTLIALGGVLLAESVWVTVTGRDVAPFRAFLAHGAAAGLLAGAVAAVVLLPQAELSRWLFKPPLDDAIPAGQPVEALLVNFVIRDPAFFGSSLFNLGAIPIGHYSYVGALPFVFLLGVSGAWRRGQRRAIVWLVVIGLVALFYAAGNHTPLWLWFQSLPGAAALRSPERMLGVATVALLALAAVGLDRWWGRAARHTVCIVPARLQVRLNPTRLGLAALAALSLALVYRGNAGLLRLERRDLQGAAVIRAVREQVGEREFHLWVPGDFSLLASSGVRVGQVNPPLVWVVDRPPPLPDWVQVAHHAGEFALLREGETPAPVFGRAEPIAAYSGYTLFRLPDAMPYAFLAPLAATPEQTLLDAPRRTRAVEARRPTPRQIVVQAAAQRGERLVVAESFYPGWKVTVDGEAATVEPFNGFLSVRLPPGAHAVRFHFDPWLPKVGLALTLLALPYTLAVLKSNLWLPLATVARKAPM